MRFKKITLTQYFFLRLQCITLIVQSFSRSTILVKLEKLDSSQLQYEPGDHIGIYPCNNHQMVGGELCFCYILMPIALFYNTYSVCLDDKNR